MGRTVYAAIVAGAESAADTCHVAGRIGADAGRLTGRESELQPVEALLNRRWQLSREFEPGTSALLAIRAPRFLCLIAS